MLVLTRRKGERLLIGENINLVITAIEGNRVRIGIEAPDEVNIRRGEVKPRTEEEGGEKAA